MNYNEKSHTYFSNIRHDLISMIGDDQKGLKVLEIGAGYGDTLFYLKEQGIASEAVGVDIFEDKQGQAKYKNVDRFLFGDIEQLDLTEYTNYFDLILLPDVLEHIFEPGKVLQKIKTYLKPGGNILVSMPNVRHFSVFKKIFLEGDFKYEESGIFDYTHVRFYCRKNIVRLLEGNGYVVMKQQSSIKNYKGKSVAKTLNEITFGIFEEFLAYQYFFKANADSLNNK